MSSQSTQVCSLYFRSLLALLAVAILPNCSFGQTNQKGFTVDYVDSWPASTKIKYVRAIIKPVGGVAQKDTDFTVVAKYDDYNDSGFVTSTRISIKTGDTEAIGELYVPSAYGYKFSIHTETDGNLSYDRGDYALQSYREYGQQFAYGQPAVPSLIFASSEVIADQSNQFIIGSPKLRYQQSFTGLGVTTDYFQLDDLEAAYENSNTSFGGGRSYINLKGFASPRVGHMSLEALPSRWFGYEGVDLLVITFDDLQVMSSKHPGKLVAIERWIAASGRLLVLNCGKNLEQTSTVVEILGDKPINEGPDRQCRFLKRPYKTKELVRKESNQYQSSGVPMFAGGGPIFTNVPQDETVVPKTARTAIGTGNLKDVLLNKKSEGMIAFNFKEGQIICLSDSYSFWGTESKNIDVWSAVQTFIFNVTPSKLDHSASRTGTPFRSFGFPEFDEPPRYLFESSILLYLLAVGPVTFFILKRKHLLNLMFVVVPFVSVVFCTGILAYAIFAEGFDTRVNVFTISRLDQKSGRITTSGLAHIYSGVTPSEYRFDGSAYGLVNLPRYGRLQKIRWGNGSEEISGGEVRARTNHQLFSRSSSKADSRLLISVGNKGEAGEAAAVKNEFETPVVAVAFKTKSCGKDEVWICKNLAPGELQRGVKVSMSDAAKTIREAVRDRGSSTVLASRHKLRNISTNYNSNSTDTDSANVVQNIVRCWGLTATGLESLLRGSNVDGYYFAVVEGSLDYEMPIENAKVEGNIHVVIGER